MAGKNYRIGIVIEAQDKLTTRMEKMRLAAQRLGKMKVSPTVTLNDHMSSQIKSLEGKMKSFASATLKLGVVAGAGAAAGIGYGLKLAGEMEQANIAFETMLGSADKAKQFMNDLIDFAVKTPFEMPQLRDATKKLLAFGFESEKVIPMLTAVGDAASGLGLGSEGLDRIIIALGQIKAKSRIQAQEMLQLTEAGIPAWDILAKKMNISTAEVMKLSENGLIPANEAIEMLLSGMSEKFPQMMDKQSRSLFGLISTLKDFINLRFFTAFGEGIRRAAVPALQKFVAMLDKNKAGANKVEEALTKLGETVGSYVVNKFEALYKWFEELSSDEAFQRMNFGDKMIYVLTRMIQSVKTWLQSDGGEQISAMMGLLGEFLSKGLNALTPLLVPVAITLGAALAKGILWGFAEAISSSPIGALFFGGLGGFAMGGPAGILPGVAAGGVAWAGTKFLSAVHDSDQMQALWRGLNSGSEAAQAASPKTDFPLSREIPKDVSTEQVLSIMNRYGNAAGNIISRPMFGFVGEDGPEAIIPLSEKRRARGLSLWEEAGRMMGVRPYASGGFAGAMPAMDGVGGINVVCSNNVVWGPDEDTLALQIGRKIVSDIKQAMQNKG